MAPPTSRRSGLGAAVAPVISVVPVLDPLTGQYLGPRPMPGVGTAPGCDASRVALAGGALQSLLVDPSVTPFEQLYRRLPDEGMFSPSVSPERPFAFELGAFKVPERMCLILFDLRPDIYRFSGIDAGDFVPVESRRFGSIMGFELTVDGRHPGNVNFQVNPVPIQRTPQAFAQPQALPSGQQGTLPQSSFNIATAGQFASASSAGLSLMPQRPQRYGAQSVPFSLYAKGNQTVQIRCVIFRRIPSPIAFIEYDIAGMLMPQQVLEQLLACSKPSFGGRGPR